MKTVLLTHYSRHPEASGNPGDIVEAPDALADGWIATRGAVLVRRPRPTSTEQIERYLSPQVIVTAVAAEQPIKRKRGRPRKNVAPNE